MCRFFSPVIGEGLMELLFDDLWLDRKAGVRRVIGVPRKEPEPVLEPVEASRDRHRLSQTMPTP